MISTISYHTKSTYLSLITEVSVSAPGRWILRDYLEVPLTWAMRLPPSETWDSKKNCYQFWLKGQTCRITKINELPSESREETGQNMFLLLFDVPMTLHSKIRTCFMVFLWGKYSGEISQMQTALEAPGKSIERSHILGYFFKIWVIIGIIFSKMFGKVQLFTPPKKIKKNHWNQPQTTGKSTFSPSRRVPVVGPTHWKTPKRRNWKVREAVAPKHQHGHREWTAWNTSRHRCGGTQHRGVCASTGCSTHTVRNGWLAEKQHVARKGKQKWPQDAPRKTIARKTVGELK